MYFLEHPVGTPGSLVCELVWYFQDFHMVNLHTITMYAEYLCMLYPLGNWSNLRSIFYVLTYSLWIPIKEICIHLAWVWGILWALFLHPLTSCFVEYFYVLTYSLWMPTKDICTHLAWVWGILWTPFLHPLTYLHVLWFPWLTVLWSGIIYGFHYELLDFTCMWGIVLSPSMGLSWS